MREAGDAHSQVFCHSEMANAVRFDASGVNFAVVMIRAACVQRTIDVNGDFAGAVGGGDGKLCYLLGRVVDVAVAS